MRIEREVVLVLEEDDDTITEVGISQFEENMIGCEKADDWDALGGAAITRETHASCWHAKADRGI